MDLSIAFLFLVLPFLAGIATWYLGGNALVATKSRGRRIVAYVFLVVVVNALARGANFEYAGLVRDVFFTFAAGLVVGDFLFAGRFPRAETPDGIEGKDSLQSPVQE